MSPASLIATNFDTEFGMNYLSVRLPARLSTSPDLTVEASVDQLFVLGGLRPRTSTLTEGVSFSSTGLQAESPISDSVDSCLSLDSLEYEEFCLGLVQSAVWAFES